MSVPDEELFLVEQEFIREMERKGVPANPAPALEEEGWEAWLTTIFPFWFDESFSEQHKEFWTLFWRVIHLERQGVPIPSEMLNIMLILARGLGKSAMVEVACMMRGAMLDRGYSLMISETDDQAKEHLANCRLLIDHSDSKLTYYYPRMEIAEDSEEFKGMPTADRQEMFICRNGFVVRAKGLQSKMRGLRIGNQRPNTIFLDDIDDVNDSLALSLNKLRLISSSIFGVQAKHNPMIVFAQNLISENSVVNQIYTGKTDVFASRTVIGPANAFTQLKIDSGINDDGKLRHIIHPDSVPAWSGLDITRAQKFLDDSGLDAFYAEYQNQFDRYRSGRVIKEYDEKRQVISWKQFAEVYGERRIPAYWNACVRLDVGYSTGRNPHFSAWVFAATSAMNTPYPGRVFIYRARSFQGTSIDDQAEEVKLAMWKGEKPRSWEMSHEKSGEMMILNKMGLPFRKIQAYGAEDGVAQWRSLSKPDDSEVNPFNGESDCRLYYIVDDDQLINPRDDGGMQLLREQVSTWDYVPTKITESGRTEQKPSKMNDDFPDAIKSALYWFGEKAVPLTFEERVEAAANERIPRADLVEMLEQATDSQYKAHLINSQSIMQSEIQKELRKEYDVPRPAWEELY